MSEAAPDPLLRPRTGHIFMVRPDLLDLAAPNPPPGVRIRTYCPGDETAWFRIVQAAYGGCWPPDAFDRCVLSDLAFAPERLFFAVDATDRAVGVAGAFQKLYHGARTGYVHMLAVDPAYQRRGIGSALLRRCLLYFREQGWTDAVLDTEIARAPAIRLYLQHGFRPLLETPQDARAWHAFQQQV